MAGFNESNTVQQPILDLLVSAGWKHIPGHRLDRHTEDVLLESDLRAALARLNPAIAEAPERTSELLTTLRSIMLSAREDGLVPSNQHFLEWLRGQKTHRFQGREAYDPVQLIDFANPANNVLVVSDEVTFGTTGHSCRFDLVLWVNGLPLVIIETKTRLDARVTWLKAANDVHTIYEPGWPEFFVPNAFSVATDGKDFHYGGVGQEIESWGVWGSTEEDILPAGWPRVKRSVELLLNPATVLSVIADFTAFELKGKHSGLPRLHKIVPRYPQVEAVRAIHARALHGTKRQGLIHHTQGSGKTLAMLFAAVKLVNEPKLKNPSIILIADRIQLVTQMYRQFLRAGMPSLEAPDTAPELRRVLSDDRRGLVFSTVHKFKNAGVLNARENIIVLIDEAHRTQEGQLGKFLRAAFPNARFFGFTGTPIADEDRNTYELFGDQDDPNHVMNSYDSDRSIADGTTVPMHVSPRLVDFHIRKAELDKAFDELAAEEGLTEQEQEYVAAKATGSRTFFANPDRVRKVCADIIEHFYSTIDPLGMKAQIVVFDRGLCVAYYEELTRQLLARGKAGASTDEAAVIMSVQSKDHTDWQEFRLTDDKEEALLNRFRQLGDPLKFLVVTAKLGTGFDAPIEGVMYLDKPMKLHTLYQTITRTNRNWKNPATGQEKRYGLIVDYVGLGDGFARAMAPANPEHARKEIETDSLLEQFEIEIANVLDRFAGIDRSASGFEALQAAHDRIPDNRAMERFGAQYLMLQGIWEAAYPDLRLEAHRDDYKWLSKVYASVAPADDTRDLLWHRLGAKTLELVHGHIGEVTISDTGVDVVIADEGTIRRLIEAGVIDPDAGSGETQISTAAEVVDNIATRLRKRLAGDNGSHPAYKTLSERLERLRERQLAKAHDSVDFLRDLLDLARDLAAAEKAEDESGTVGLDLLPDPNVGALTQIFEEYKPEGVPVIVGKVVTDIDAIVKEVRWDGWNNTKEGDKAVRIAIRKVLVRYALPASGELFDRAYAYVAENY
ncbi:type I restriction endonuclease subunit R [Arthrobacter cupressi]|uniref:Type I restriction enzyme endonuclease subunit n=1 Tax=Arthrobacter cupressi TaxID=1045773 RepID=A0A1G8SQH4_9MICC|nr:HsdR family type I site-specific deoxyribonuclease [Arthrobacter cupressi]NYD78430.1 type I restriction enzyme R subunit [Arthrobacter cupressi]SDJ31518.1 type I restriction enzyme, R subunit [Arthrobacter cupressi]